MPRILCAISCRPSAGSPAIANPSRAAAAISAALDAYQIRGVSHNIPFLSALLRHPRFIAGRLTTGFIAEEFPDGFQGAKPNEEERQLLAAVAAVVHHRAQQRDQQISGRLSPAKESGGADYVVVLGLDQLPVTVAETAGGHAVIGDGASIELIGDWHPGDTLYRGRADGDTVAVQVDRIGIGYRLNH